MGANVVGTRSCPNCGAPVSPQHTLMQCEFCGSPLIVVKPQAPPQATPPPPVSPFGAYGGNVLPAPPHDYGQFHVRRRSGGPAVAIAMAGVLVVGASAAVFMLGFSPGHSPPPTIAPPPPPTAVAAEPPPVAVAPGAGVEDQAKMFEAQCNGGNAQSCVMAGALYEHGPSTADRSKARALYERACTLGNAGGCHMRDAMRK